MVFHPLAALLDVIEMHVGIREYDLVDGVIGQQVFEFLFRMDRDTLRVPGTRQFGRVTAIVNMGNLCRRECDDVDVPGIPVAAVEQVEVPTSGPHDDDPAAHNGFSGNYALEECYAPPLRRPIRAST